MRNENINMQGRERINKERKIENKMTSRENKLRLEEQVDEEQNNDKKNGNSQKSYYFTYH